MENTVAIRAKKLINSNPQEAIDLLEEALRTDSDNSHFHSLLGVAYGQEGEYDLAVAEFKKSLSISPNNPTTLRNLARVLEKQGRIDEAIEAISRALEKNPRDKDSKRIYKRLTSQEAGNIDNNVTWGYDFPPSNHEIRHNNHPPQPAQQYPQTTPPYQQPYPSYPPYQQQPYPTYSPYQQPPTQYPQPNPQSNPQPATENNANFWNSPYVALLLCSVLFPIVGFIWGIVWLIVGNEKKRIWGAIGIVMSILFFILALAVIGSDMTASNQIPDPNIGIVSEPHSTTSQSYSQLKLLHWEFKTDSRYNIPLKWIEGDARNNGSSDIDYARVEFSLYDNQRRLVGTAWDNILNWKSGSTWHFDALVFSDEAIYATFEGFTTI